MIRYTPCGSWFRAVWTAPAIKPYQCEKVSWLGNLSTHVSFGELHRKGNKHCLGAVFTTLTHLSSEKVCKTRWYRNTTLHAVYTRAMLLFRLFTLLRNRYHRCEQPNYLLYPFAGSESGGGRGAVSRTMVNRVRRTTRVLKCSTQSLSELAFFKLWHSSHVHVNTHSSDMN